MSGINDATLLAIALSLVGLGFLIAFGFVPVLP